MQEGYNMILQVKKWGNSLAVRLPKDISKALSVQNNSFLELELVGDGLLLKPKKSSELDKLISQINPQNLHAEIKTGKSVGNEIW